MKRVTSTNGLTGMKRMTARISVRPSINWGSRGTRSLRRQLLRLAVIGAMAFQSQGVVAEDIVVTSINDSGAGTLREAITNAAAGDRIVFNITGPATITLSSDLPEMTDSISFTNQNVAPVTIDLNGRSPLNFTGGVIDLGELRVINSVNPEEIVLDTSTTWIGGGEQITGDIIARGIVMPGSSNGNGSVAEMDIDGALTADDSTLRMDIHGGAATPNDRIDVTGTASIDNATLRPFFMGSDYSIGDTFTLMSTGGLSGTLANSAEVFQLPNNPFLEAISNVGANDLSLILQDNGDSFVDALNGCNLTDAAAELDFLRGGGSAAQMTAINQLRSESSMGVRQAAGQLAGALYPSLVDAQINEAHNTMHALRDRVLLQQSDLYTSGHWSPWVRGYGMSLDTQVDHCPAEGYRRTIGGVEIGTGYIAPVGLGVHGFVQIGAADTNMMGLGQEADTDLYRFGGAAQYVGERFYVFGSGGYGYQDHSIDRSMSVLQTGTSAQSDLDGNDQFASIEVGSVMSSDDWLWLSFISLQGAQADLGAASETGDSDFVLDTTAIDGQSLRTTVGCSLAGTNATQLGPATTQLRFGWMHEYLDDQQMTIATVRANGNDMNTRSAETGRDWLSLGAQLDWGMILGGQMTFAYQGNLNSKSTFQSGLVGTRWIW